MVSRDGKLCGGPNESTDQVISLPMTPLARRLRSARSAPGAKPRQPFSLQSPPHALQIIIVLRLGARGDGSLLTIMREGSSFKASKVYLARHFL